MFSCFCFFAKILFSNLFLKFFQILHGPFGKKLQKKKNRVILKKKDLRLKNVFSIVKFSLPKNNLSKKVTFKKF
jgi:hypothetical protein